MEMTFWTGRRRGSRKDEGFGLSSHFHCIGVSVFLIQEERASLFPALVSHLFSSKLNKIPFQKKRLIFFQLNVFFNIRIQVF